MTVSLSTYFPDDDTDIGINIITEDNVSVKQLSQDKKIPTETPTTICTVKTIGAFISHKVLRILLDSGSSKTLIKRSALPS